MKQWFLTHAELPFCTWYHELQTKKEVWLDDQLAFQSQDQDLNIPFTEALACLQGKGIITADFLEKRQLRLVAQSIDGDYIFGSDQKTYIIPVDLHEADVEHFPLAPPKFIAQLITGQVHSHILAYA